MRKYKLKSQVSLSICHVSVVSITQSSSFGEFYQDMSYHSHTTSSLERLSKVLSLNLRICRHQEANAAQQLHPPRTSDSHALNQRHQRQRLPRQRRREALQHRLQKHAAQEVNSTLGSKEYNTILYASELHASLQMDFILC